MINSDIVRDVGFSWLLDDFWHGAVLFFFCYMPLSLMFEWHALMV